MTAEGRDVPRPSREPSDAEPVVHKATRECPIVEPHPAALCGIVQARRRAQANVSPGRGPA